MSSSICSLINDLFSFSGHSFAVPKRPAGFKTGQHAPVPREQPYPPGSRPSSTPDPSRVHHHEPHHSHTGRDHLAAQRQEQPVQTPAEPHPPSEPVTPELHQRSAASHAHLHARAHREHHLTTVIWGSESSRADHMCNTLSATFSRFERTEVC